MSKQGDVAEAVVSALAERVAVWQPGSYAGGLYAVFDAAARAVAHVPFTERHHVAERLHRLARKVGILLPSIIDAPGVRLLAIVRTESTREEIEAAIAHQDSRGFRVAPSLGKPTTYAVWTERPQRDIGQTLNHARQVEELGVALRCMTTDGCVTSCCCLHNEARQVPECSHMKIIGLVFMLAGCAVARSTQLDGLLWTAVALLLCTAGGYFIVGEYLRANKGP